jgi:hypothetical protein
VLVLGVRSGGFWKQGCWWMHAGLTHRHARGEALDGRALERHLGGCLGKKKKQVDVWPSRRYINIYIRRNDILPYEAK